MIADRDLVAVEKVGSPYSFGTMPRANAEAAISLRDRGEGWLMSPVPTCRCCGEPAWENLRCTKHQDRNPCAAEGCTRTRAAVNGRLHDDWSLCGEHYRAFVPPGSPARRAFNRLARLAKRLGYKRTDRWPAELEERWWRLWRGVLRRVRRGPPEGHIDQREIERLFGWDDKDA